MTKAQFNLLAEIMNRWFGMPDREVTSQADREALRALKALGYLTDRAGVWRNTELGTRAYMETIMFEAGKESPWGSFIIKVP